MKNKVQDDGMTWAEVLEARIAELEAERHALFVKLCSACKDQDYEYPTYCVKHEHHVCFAGSCFVKKQGE